MKCGINAIVSVLTTGLVYFFGGWDVALQTMLVILVIDYITGVCKAIYNKKMNSKIGAKGIVKKVGYLCIIALTTMLDRTAGDTGTIRTLVIYFFVANEGLSILENWASMNLPLPVKLYEALEQIKENNNPKSTQKNNIEKKNK